MKIPTSGIRHWTDERHPRSYADTRRVKKHRVPKFWIEERQFQDGEFVRDILHGS